MRTSTVKNTGGLISAANRHSKAMLRDMEDSLGIWGDIIGVLSLFGTFYILFFFAGVL